MNSRNAKTLSLVIATALSLSACGGDGSSTPINPPADTTPNSFTLGESLYNIPGAEVISDSVTVSGIDAATLISLQSGFYRINGGSWTDVDGNVENGDLVEVRLTAPDTYIARNSDGKPVKPVNSLTLTIGGVSDSFSVGTGQDANGEDITVSNASFSDVSPVLPGDTVSTESLTVSDIDNQVLVVVESGDIFLNGVSTGQVAYAQNGDTLSVEIDTPDTYGADSSVAYLIGDTLSSFEVITYDSESDVPASYVLHVPDCSENPDLYVCQNLSRVKVVTWEENGSRITGEYTLDSGEPITLRNPDTESLNVSVIVDIVETGSERFANSYIGLTPGEYDLLSTIRTGMVSPDPDVDCNSVNVTLTGATGQSVGVAGSPDITQAYIRDPGTLKNGQRTITVDYCDTDSLYITDTSYNAGVTTLQGSVTVQLDGSADITANLSPAQRLQVNSTTLPIQSVFISDGHNYAIQGAAYNPASPFISSTVTYDGRTETPSGLNMEVISAPAASSQTGIYLQYVELHNVATDMPVDVAFGTNRAVLNSDADTLRDTGTATYSLEGSQTTDFVEVRAELGLMESGGNVYISHSVFMSPSIGNFDGEQTVTFPTLPGFDMAQLNSTSATIILYGYNMDDADNLSDAMQFMTQNSEESHRLTYSYESDFSLQ